MNLKSVMLSERNQSQSLRILDYIRVMVSKGQNCPDGEHVTVARGWERGEGVTRKGVKEMFYLFVVMVVTRIYTYVKMQSTVYQIKIMLKINM